MTKSSTKRTAALAALVLLLSAGAALASPPAERGNPNPGPPLGAGTPPEAGKPSEAGAPPVAERERLDTPPFAAVGVKILSGNALVVETPEGKGYRVHLYGVRTPYKTQPLGGAAARKLAELALGRELEVQPKVAGPQHAIYAEVGSAAAPSFARALLAAGLAHLDLDLAPEYRALQKVLDDARDRGVGLWALEDPQDPLAYRRSGGAVPAVGIR